jgi:hypothetical protein
MVVKPKSHTKKAENKISAFFCVKSWGIIPNHIPFCGELFLFIPQHYSFSWSNIAFCVELFLFIPKKIPFRGFLFLIIPNSQMRL